MFAVVAYLLGARLTRGTDYRGAAEKVSFCTALGLGLISHFVLAAGLLHILSSGVMLAVLTAITLISLPPVSVTREWVARLPGRVSPLKVTLAALTVALAIPILQMPLYPPTQWDAISYHLASAKIYVREGAVVYTPYLRFPVFPQSSEMLFTLMLLLADDIAAQLTQFLMMALTALALYGWGARMFTQRAGALAAVLWLSNPLVLWLGTAAYVDAGLALYLTLAFFSLYNWRKIEAENQRHGWLAISAALFWFAATTKYLALFPILCAGTYLLAYSVKQRSLRPALIFSVITIAVACPWYIRNAWYTGNPVWPYFPEWFGFGPWTGVDIANQKF